MFRQKIKICAKITIIITGSTFDELVEIEKLQMLFNHSSSKVDPAILIGIFEQFVSSDNFPERLFRSKFEMIMFNIATKMGNEI
jgi:hypothetical protein